jgi:hypothetical protein
MLATCFSLPIVQHFVTLIHLVKTRNYDPHYEIVFIILLLPAPYIRIFSAANCSQIPTVSALHIIIVYS